jgi:hypothetical protein
MTISEFLGVHAIPICLPLHLTNSLLGQPSVFSSDTLRNTRATGALSLGPTASSPPDMSFLMNLSFPSPTCLPLPWHPPTWIYFWMTVNSPLHSLEQDLCVQVHLPWRVGLASHPRLLCRRVPGLGLQHPPLDQRPVALRAQATRPGLRPARPRPVPRTALPRPALLAMRPAALPRRPFPRPVLLPLHSTWRQLPVAPRPKDVHWPRDQSPSPPSTTRTPCAPVASLAWHGPWIASTSMPRPCPPCPALSVRPCQIPIGVLLCKLSMMHCSPIIPGT